MIKATREIVITLAAAALLSCSADPSARNEPAPAAELLGIELTAADALAWSYRHEIAADLDGDGSPESVVLASDVEVAAGGRPLWEDGHRWALLIEGGGEATLAYAAFVPRGFVEAAVLRASSEGRRAILLQERTPERLRTITVIYDGPGRASAESAAHYQLESWLPGSAALGDRARPPDRPPPR